MGPFAKSHAFGRKPLTLDRKAGSKGHMTKSYGGEEKMFRSNIQSTRSLVVQCFAAACVGLLALSGCERPWVFPSKGELGAADISELVERYKQAHQTKDIESLRAIYQQLRFSNAGPWGHRMIGGAEEQMPDLFELELVDVELVEFPGVFPGNAVSLNYIRERAPARDNGLGSVNALTILCGKPYKLLLVARRGVDPGGQVMEIDIGLAVEEFDGRLYLTASNEHMSSVTDWVRTGRLPGVYRPPGHTVGPEGSWKLPNQVPADWVRIIRPRP
jgi:hypothetical protein